MNLQAPFSSLFTFTLVGSLFAGGICTTVSSQSLPSHQSPGEGVIMDRSYLGEMDSAALDLTLRSLAPLRDSGYLEYHAPWSPINLQAFARWFQYPDLTARKFGSEDLQQLSSPYPIQESQFSLSYGQWSPSWLMQVLIGSNAFPELLEDTEPPHLLGKIHQMIIPVADHPFWISIDPGAIGHDPWGWICRG